MTTCVVPGCNSNYQNQSNFTSIFYVPKDIVLREKWFRAIPRPREDYEMNKHLKVIFLFLYNLNLILLLLIYIFRFVYTISMRRALRGRFYSMMGLRWWRW